MYDGVSSASCMQNTKPGRSGQSNFANLSCTGYSSCSWNKIIALKKNLKDYSLNVEKYNPFELVKSCVMQKTKY